MRDLTPEEYLMKKDALTLKKIAIKNRNSTSFHILVLMLVPYISMFVFESQKRFSNVIDINKLEFDLEDMRLKIKALNVRKINKTLEMITKTRKLSTSYFMNICKSPGRYTDLGFYFSKKKILIYNTISSHINWLPSSVYSNAANLDNIKYQIDYLESDRIIPFATALGKYTNAITKIKCNNFKDNIKINLLNDKNLDIDSIDIKIERDFIHIFNNDFDIDLNLFLLHIYTEINVFLILFDYLFKNINEFQFRVMYNIFMNSISSLIEFKKYLIKKEIFNTEIKTFYENIQIDKLSDNYYNRGFYNCMRHYNFQDGEGNSIPIDKLDYSKFFCGIINYFFIDENEKSLYKKIKKELNDLSFQLEHYLNLNFDNYVRINLDD